MTIYQKGACRHSSDGERCKRSEGQVAADKEGPYLVRLSGGLLVPRLQQSAMRVVHVPCAVYEAAIKDGRIDGPAKLGLLRRPAFNQR
jgi:hypothetical protein